MRKLVLVVGMLTASVAFAEYTLGLSSRLALQSQVEEFDTENKQVDKRIEVESNGKRFYPLINPNAGQSLMTQGEFGLYSGQLMQRAGTNTVGELTGSILVKTREPNANLKVDAVKQTAIGKHYILFVFSKQQNLLKMLTQLKKNPLVEGAELEVNTRSQRAH
ncbi:hypothetical protein [Bermanella sp. R86510]|uniref:hypothetical protein n=1 Tax=unclassified Bermanella TaxID=2627862 RepID=UPI0037CC4CBD